MLHYFNVPSPRTDTKVTFNPTFKTSDYVVVVAGTSGNNAYFYDKTPSSVMVNILEVYNEINGIAIGLSA